MTRQVTLGCVVTLLVSIGSLTIAACAVADQSEKSASPVGVDSIKRVLTGHRQWTLYWDRRPLQRPHLGLKTADRSPHATLEFMRVGVKVIGHAQDDRVHHIECEFEVAIVEGGFTLPGCVGSDKTMTYDPHDREYPFKGRAGGTLFWLAPKD